MSRRLARIHDRAKTAEVTYAEVGVTREPACPPGYRRVSRSLALGRGEAEFARAKRALREWATHRGFGRGIYPERAGQEVGDTVVAVLGFGPVAVTGPCRVVWRVDEQRRSGFGYGTLPGHPVTGEESFVLVMDPGGLVEFTITAVSRPGGALARVAGPIGRLAQRVAMAAYLRALR
ncbi:DUF1990 domain-containing protein [Crossiella sp. SN42]|uniref:DUF1990 family protein n=1 Tax=Crossiella sp. SN42 TaxID=2944808 RepID=UPI00207D57A7|nr:DUF1990 domain-containing protein [Crossiella sp. SN42]MCO1581593.1 DUF1990 domain-containing protein [Crossiella sp. SN42]